MTSIIGSMAGQSLGNVTALILVRTKNWGLCTRQVIKARTILEVELMLNNLLCFIDLSSGKTGRQTKIFQSSILVKKAQSLSGEVKITSTLVLSDLSSIIFLTFSELQWKEQRKPRVLLTSNLLLTFLIISFITCVACLLEQLYGSNERNSVCES